MVYIILADNLDREQASTVGYGAGGLFLPTPHSACSDFRLIWVGWQLSQGLTWTAWYNLKRAVEQTTQKLSLATKQ